VVGAPEDGSGGVGVLSGVLTMLSGSYGIWEGGRGRGRLAHGTQVQGAISPLLKSFWVNETVFQMIMLAYNLVLLFKFDSLYI
jgi:hypothetical protein